MIYGESAGATSVSLHLVMPGSAGLFHSAAIDSGAFNQWTYYPFSYSTDIYRTLLKQLGCDAWGDPVQCLKSKSTMTLLRISDAYYGNASLPHKESAVGTQWAPAVDGLVLPDKPTEMLRRGQVHKGIPILLGTNRDEGAAPSV